MHTLTMSKWQSVKQGKREVFSDAELDALSDYFSPLETDEASLFFKHFVTVHNPQQIGTKDYWLGYIKREEQCQNI